MMSVSLVSPCIEDFKAIFQDEEPLAIARWLEELIWQSQRYDPNHEQ